MTRRKARVKCLSLFELADTKASFEKLIERECEVWMLRRRILFEGDFLKILINIEWMYFIQEEQQIVILYSLIASIVCTHSAFQQN